MLIVKGSRVRFVLASGRTVSAPGGMMHDPEGASWPRCSVVVGPFTKGGPVEDKPSSSARAYLGRGYVARRGSVNLPPRALEDGWRELGEVARIYYVRVGNVYGGEHFKHDFSKGFFAKRPPVLYRRGRFLRLELGPGCTVNARGFVSP